MIPSRTSYRWFYDNIHSRYYDLMLQWCCFPFGGEKKVRRRLLDGIAFRSAGERTLDLGCGTGSATLAIAAKAGPRGRIVGLDLSAGQLRRANAKNRCANVTFLPFQPRERLPETLTACDAGVVSLKREALGMSVPSKLYGVLASGRPVIAVVPEGAEAARVVREAGCGLLVDPGDARGLAEALKLLGGNPERAKSLGSAARKAFDGSYDLPGAAGGFEKLLLGLRPGA